MATSASHQPRQRRVDTWIESAVLAVIVALAAAALLSGCLAEKEEAVESGETPTWATLTSGSGALVGCLGGSCHNDGANTPNLESDQYATLTSGVTCFFLTCVDAGSKETSGLYMRLGDPATSMPAYSGTSQRTDIGAWIDAGALEN